MPVAGKLDVHWDQLEASGEKTMSHYFGKNSFYDTMPKIQSFLMK